MSSSSNHIIDTVVLLYFLLVNETDLLCALLGRPLQVPLAVYDAEDRGITLLSNKPGTIIHQAMRELQSIDGILLLGLSQLTPRVRTVALIMSGSRCSSECRPSVGNGMLCVVGYCKA